MIEHPGFISDIIENKEDDTPRLIYADWLQDNGHDDRAEFIRLQIELAKVSDYCSCGSCVRARTKPGERIGQHTNGPCANRFLRRRERELLCASPKVNPTGHTNMILWAPVLLQMEVMGWAYKRGFVEELTCFPSAFSLQSDDIITATPLKLVKFKYEEGLFKPGALRRDPDLMPMVIQLYEERYTGIKFTFPD